MKSAPDSCEANHKGLRSVALAVVIVGLFLAPTTGSTQDPFPVIYASPDDDGHSPWCQDYDCNLNYGGYGPVRNGQSVTYASDPTANSGADAAGRIYERLRLPDGGYSVDSIDSEQSEEGAEEAGREVGYERDPETGTGEGTETARQAGEGLGERLDRLADRLGVWRDTARLKRALPAALGGPSDDEEAANDTGDDPVHPGTGEFRIDELDMYFAGVGLPFELTRVYRNQWSYHGPLGFGWNHNYNQRLQSDGDCTERIYWITGRGARIAFVRHQDTWRSDTDGLVLVEAPDGWVLTHADGMTSEFDLDGLLRTRRDLNANELLLDWEQNGQDWRLAQVTDTIGRVFEFDYDLAGHLQTVRLDGADVAVHYVVDGDGNLASFTDMHAAQVHYDYDFGHPEEGEHVVPALQAESACLQQCLGDGVCASEGESLCASAAIEAGAACRSACQPSSCNTLCDEACGEVCEVDSGYCATACHDECDSRCWQTGLNQCRRLAETYCPSSCNQTCRSSCTESCSAWAAVHDPESFGRFIAGLGETIVAYFLDGAADVISCIVHGFTLGALGDCEWGEDHLGYEARHAFCNTGCTACCEEGIHCDSGTCQKNRSCVDDCSEVFLRGDAALPDRCDDPFRGPFEDTADPGCPTRTHHLCVENCDASTCVQGCLGPCHGACTDGCLETCPDEQECNDHCDSLDFVGMCQDACVSSCLDTQLAEGPQYGHPAFLNHNLTSIRREGEPDPTTGTNMTPPASTRPPPGTARPTSSRTRSSRTTSPIRWAGPWASGSRDSTSLCDCSGIS